MNRGRPIGFEVAARDLEPANAMTKSLLAAPGPNSRDVFIVRGERVMLDSVVAEAFGTETKRVNEAVSRNPEKFTPAHTFRLSEEEADALRSQTATSNPGRGGARYVPHVFTVKGVARLATVLNTPAALRATDLIIDTFLTVHEQLRRGRKTVLVQDADRLRPNAEQRQEAAKLRSKLAAALSRLLDSIVDVENQQTVRQTSHSVGSKALQSIQERLRAKGLENEKLEADTTLVLAQAEKTLAEARKARLEADGIDIANFERRIAAVKRVADLIKDVEPPELVTLIEQFEAEPLRLGGPGDKGE